ncbi:MAG: asparagine--tRNA ligase [Buchnera aphidicola (Nurudea yanoniella)]
MNTSSIFDICKNKVKVNKYVCIKGWVKNKRNSKSGITFIDIYDGSCLHTLQVLVYCSLSNYYEEVEKLTTGCSIVVYGTLIRSFKNEQLYELQTKKLKVIGWVKNPSKYPISSKKHTFEYLRKYSHLRPRTNFIGAISRIRNCLFQALHQFFYQKGYYWVSVPIITGLNSEGGGEMFKVSTLNFSNIPINNSLKTDFKKDFFGKESFLSVSGQLNLEAYACALSKVYSFGPTFRAENSNTTRHLSEFWMLEAETAFFKLDDLMNFSESMLKNVVNVVLEKCSTDIEFLQKILDTDIFLRLKQFLDKKFFRIEYIEAINILKKSGAFPINSIFAEMSLSSEHEKYLIEKHFNFPTIIINYPKSLKAFYMKLNKDNKTVAAIDLLVPSIGEILGGSEREEKLDVLDKRISECGLNKKSYWWYRDLRKYGTVPHSGFGLGFERFLSYITGVKNIRDVSPFPRTANNFDV